MNRFSVINWSITVSVTLLLSISILVIYSSSPSLALQQFFFSFFGLCIFFGISQIDYRSLRPVLTWSYIGILVFLVVVFIIGVETRGSTRWIDLGLLNIQPSELTKPVLILILAQFWSKHSPTWLNIGKSLLWMFLPELLIFRQPDLGTFLVIFAIWGGMLFAARISFKKIILLSIVGLLALPVVWFTLHDYQKQRIVSFLSPGKDPLGEGYNIIQSTIAVGSGQIFGRGLGQGTQSRLQFLPEFRTDFIFASIAEELGFVGSLIIIIIYFFLISYLLKEAMNAYDGFGFLIIFGVLSMLSFQIIVNIGMNIGIFPITGITLPLISYGGSSIISIFISLGVVASVIRYRKRIDIQTFEG